MKWEKVVAPPSPEHERFRSDALWFSENYNELKAQYPNQWVGIYHKQVAGASPDGMAILAKLKAEGLPIGHIFFHFVHGKEYHRVLGSSLHWNQG